MPPRSVILRDFDPEIQRRIHFSPGVCASFFDPQYTDENDGQLTWVYSPPNEIKKREVKYGNNIAVLFKALYHCRDFYHWPNFWQAISTGWKANAKCVEVIASILTHARTAYRDGPGRGRDACQTAKAVDLWIDYLNSPSDRTRAFATHPFSPTSAGVLFQTAKDFYTKMNSKMVNAARISPDSKQPSPPLSAGLPAKPPGPSGKRAGHAQQHTPIKTEGQGGVQSYDRNNLVRSSRKRSLSPDSSESPRSKRPSKAALDAHRREEPAQRHEEQQQTGSADRQASPSISRRDMVDSSTPPQTESKNVAGGQVTGPSPNPAPGPVPGNSITSSTAKGCPAMAIMGNTIREAERQADTAGAIMRVQLSNNEIKEDRTSFKSYMETLMDSVAVIVDHVESLREDVNELKQQQKETALPREYVSNLEKLVQKAAADVTSLKADVVGLKVMTDARHRKQEEYQLSTQENATTNLKLVQETTSCIKTLMDEISELKCQQQLVPPSPPPVQLSDIKALLEGILAQQEEKLQLQLRSLLGPQEDKIRSQVEDSFAQHEDRISSQMVSYFGDQTARIDALRQEMVGMKNQVAFPVQPVQRAHPPTLRGALAAAEKDIHEHREMMQSIFNKIDMNRGGNVALTSQIADLLVSLDQSLSTVRAILGPSQQ